MNNTDDPKLDNIDGKCTEFVDNIRDDLDDIGYPDARVNFDINLNSADLPQIDHKANQKVDIPQTILMNVPWGVFTIFLMYIMTSMVEASKIIANESNQLVYLLVMLFVVMRLVSIIDYPEVCYKV